MKLKFFICALLLYSTHTFSKVKEDTLDIGPIGSFNSFEKKQNLKSAPGYGGRLGYNIWRHFGLQASVEYFKTKVLDPSVTEPINGRFLSSIAKEDVDVRFYYFDIVYHMFPDAKIIPFLFLGYGAASYTPKVSTTDLSLYNAGMGLRYFFSEHFSVRLEAHDLYVSDKFKDGFHNFNVALGIQFSCGTSFIPGITSREENIRERKISKILQVEVIHFAKLSADLSYYAMNILRNVVITLRKHPKSIVRISGYASSSGSEALNNYISEKRAKNVRNYILQSGSDIDPERLLLEIFSSRKPVFYEPFPDDQNSPEVQSNMRVLLEVMEEAD